MLVIKASKWIVLKWVLNIPPQIYVSQFQYISRPSSVVHTECQAKSATRTGKISIHTSGYVTTHSS